MLLDEVDFSNDCDCNQFVDMWSKDVETKRQQSMEYQKKVNEKMVEANKRKYPVSNYSIGDEVLIKNPKAYTKRGKHILDQVASYKGKVIDKKNNEYKIIYEGAGRYQITEWFNIKNIVDITRTAERRRMKVSGDKISKRSKVS